MTQPWTIEGLPGAGRTHVQVAGAAIVNALVAETVERLIARGVMPEVYVSSNLSGAETRATRRRGRRGGIPDAHGSPFAVQGASRATTAGRGPTSSALRLIDFVGATGHEHLRVRRPRTIRRSARMAGSLRRCCAPSAPGAGPPMRCQWHDAVTYCTSPGLDMRYSDEADLAALVAKLGSVAALGVDRSGCCWMTSRGCCSTSRTARHSATWPPRTCTSSTGCSAPWVRRRR